MNGGIKMSRWIVLVIEVAVAVAITAIILVSVPWEAVKLFVETYLPVW